MHKCIKINLEWRKLQKYAINFIFRKEQGETSRLRLENERSGREVVGREEIITQGNEGAAWRGENETGEREIISREGGWMGKGRCWGAVGRGFWGGGGR